MDKVRIAWIALAVVGVGGGLLAGQKPYKPTAAQQLLIEQAHTERVVKLALRDPESAQFVHIVPGKCGYVNARNGFGGYAGNERFIISSLGLSLESAASDRGAFDRLWSDECR